MELDTQKENGLGNGDHFLSLMKTEIAHLNALVSSAENELDTDDTIPEDVKGKLRIAVGKAKLLLKKKFIQFEKLCLHNMGMKSDFRYTVTCEDLAGFWDTILIQIIQVYQKFEEVDVLRKNNWESQSQNRTIQTESYVENN